MDTKQLKSYAPEARMDFIEAITNRAATYGLLPDEVLPMEESGDVVIIGDQPFPRAVANQRRELETRISEQGFEQFIEAVAYTWFNRLVAIRYMEVHGYLDHGYRVLSHPTGENLPEVMEYAERLNLPGLDTDKVIEMKLDGQKDGELYRLILVAQCNALHRLMPFMFGSVSDATVLLLPDNLLNTESVVRKMVNGLSAESLEDVEAVGWLYQFYISEKKNDVFEALKKKKKKITPENIPAATQLFTPHWIVRYLVENSLGRLWMLNHPDSRLIGKMKYYIKPEEPEADFLQIAKPEEIKICDPACGSGHMLTYAFDLLYAIYEEQGYRATDIPKLIFENNLYGIEIDERAGALAAFVLTMKAREKNKRFLSPDKVVQPNICVLENIEVDPNGLDAYIDKVGRDLFSNGLKEVVNQWKETKSYGSLIRPMVTDVSDVVEQLRAAGVGEDLFLNKTHQKVLKALRQADYLSSKYHIIVANPPYMAASGMQASIKKWSKTKYPKSKSDAYAMFVERGTEICRPSGFIAMVTMHGWMFLSSYEDIREHLLATKSFVSLIQIGFNSFPELNSKVATACGFVIMNNACVSRGKFYNLNDASHSSDKDTVFQHKLKTSDYYSVPRKAFENIPGKVLAYWLTKKQVDVFSEHGRLEELFRSGGRNKTHGNERFMRFWWEVDSRTDKWVTYLNGGDYRRYFGNEEYVVDWSAPARQFYDEHGGLCNEEFWNKEGLTWSPVTSSNLSVRLKRAASQYSSGAPTIFNPPFAYDFLTLSYLNSSVAQCFISAINPTLNTNPNDLLAVPFIPTTSAEVESRTKSLVEISEADWNSIEMSIDFGFSPLSLINKQRLKSAYASWRIDAKNECARTKSHEEANNRFWMELFGLSAELEDKVAAKHITLFCNPIYRYGSSKSESELESLLFTDTMREFISYSVGCMLGRYSLEKPGLILANQGETADDYRQQIPEPTFAPDEDNVIPVLDGDWFDDDISERFKEFLKVTFGEEHYEENLAFLESALYPDNETARTPKTILDYFIKDFFKQHMKMYKKRPIYWLFSSGKQGAFRALIYMHRYNPSTLSRMRTAYVVPLQGKYNSRIDQLANDIPAATSTSHRKQLEKEHASFIKKRDELQTFDEKLRHYADQRIEIDLDDGVKENYSKFGDLLAEVKAITGKKPVTA